MVDAVHWVGQRSLLAEFGTLAEVMAFHGQLDQQPLAGQVEAVPAARTVLLRFRSRQAAVDAVKQVRRTKARAPENRDNTEVEIRVHYGGEDLPGLADTLGMSVEALIGWHSSQTWVGAFGGFAPGFTYCALVEETTRRRRSKRSEPLNVPRLDNPRTSVPAGSVALAGEFSAVYPRSSPGGWQLIGTTDAALWDLDRSEPALVRPGDRVQYVPVVEQIQVRGTDAAKPVAPSAPDAVLEVNQPGVRTLIEDLGRYGHGALGVPRSGAADISAVRQANQLVGNDDNAGVFEVLSGGLELTVNQTLVMAVTGAEAPVEISTPRPQNRSNMAVNGTGVATENQVEEDLREVPQRAPFWVYQGERLRIGMARRGLRSYLAVSGGVAAQRVLGSVSTDTLSGLGPAPVQAGDRYGLVGATSRFFGIADVARTALPNTDEPTVLRFVPGPRDDWFARPRGRNRGLERLQHQRWLVSDQADRVGIRFIPEEGAEIIERTHTEELPSEPMLRGAIQVPPSGEPVLFLADHPVTGGYPVIGVVVREDLGLAAQLPPGTEVRFSAVDPETLTPL